MKIAEKKAIGNMNEKKEFYSIVRDIAENDTVKKMKQFNQHCDTSCYEHCMRVSYYTYLLCKKLHFDYVSAARGSMIHDLFLYDWHTPRSWREEKTLHAFSHPKIAYENARKIFELNAIEKDVIIHHMWPVTLFSFPKTREGWMITLTDKYSACAESFDYFRRFLHTKKIYKYAYVFLSMMLFRIV